MSNNRLSARQTQIQDPIIERFLATLPSGEGITEIYLFGSRCREDWRPDSDYDILIVVEKKERELISGLYDSVMDILLDTGRLISLKIFTAAEFTRLKAIPTPFMENVMTKGKRLARHN